MTTNYTLDLNVGLTQVLTDGTDTYLYGLGRIGEYESANWTYPLTDALGSVRQLTDASGAPVMAQSYAPYGDVLESYGAETSSYGFAGEWTDETGLQYLRARYLNTGIGRFISRDTWGGDYRRPLSLNRWGYVEGNPVNRVDPSGYGTTVATFGGGTSGGQGGITAINLSTHNQYTNDECSTGVTELHDPVLNADIDRYGLIFQKDPGDPDGDSWSTEGKKVVLEAVKAVGNRFAISFRYRSPSIEFPSDPAQAFRRVYGVDDANKFIFEKNCTDCDAKGWTKEPRKIKVTSVLYSSQFTRYHQMSVNFVIHELGHAFDHRIQLKPKGSGEGKEFVPGGYYLGKAQEKGLVPDRPLGVDYEPEETYGFAGPFNDIIGGTERWIWQQSTSGAKQEEFADMFLGWVFNTWEGDLQGSRTNPGQQRATFMYDNMPNLLEMAVGSGDCIQMKYYSKTEIEVCYTDTAFP